MCGTVHKVRTDAGDPLRWSELLFVHRLSSVPKLRRPSETRGDQTVSTGCRDQQWRGCVAAQFGVRGNLVASTPKLSPQTQCASLSTLVGISSPALLPYPLARVISYFLETLKSSSSSARRMQGSGRLVAKINVPRSGRRRSVAGPMGR